MNEAQKLPCDQVVKQLWEYVDGELPDPDSEQVRAHLEACARCYPHYDFQRAYREFVRCAADQPVPPALRQRVFEAILREDTAGGPEAVGVQQAGPSADAADRSRPWWRRLLGAG